MVSFTGGVQVGKYIARKMANSGNELKKYIPELGGNAVLVIMDDCDLDIAIDLAMGAFENSGQRCTAVRRILLHEKIFDTFTDRYVESASRIKYEYPKDLKNEMGTVISSEQAELINQRVNDAVDRGGSIIN